VKGKGPWVGALIATALVAVWYYRKRSAELAQQQLNPNVSTNEALGALAGSYTDRITGQSGDTYINNYRYSEYKQYLKSGGLNSGHTFDQFLTAAQGQTLPINS
jgi:hypothetical protein